MSQVLSSAGRQSTFAPHIADVFLHRQRRFRTDSTKPKDIPTVFVVDDDVSVRESLKLLISLAGWTAETFSSAQEFLDRPRAFAPSCLVSEVSLPDLNGLELQERVAAARGEM